MQDFSKSRPCWQTATEAPNGAWRTHPRHDLRIQPEKAGCWIFQNNEATAGALRCVLSFSWFWGSKTGLVRRCVSRHHFPYFRSTWGRQFVAGLRLCDGKESGPCFPLCFLPYRKENAFSAGRPQTMYEVKVQQPMKKGPKDRPDLVTGRYRPATLSFLGV